MPAHTAHQLATAHCCPALSCPLRLCCAPTNCTCSLQPSSTINRYRSSKVCATLGGHLPRLRVFLPRVHSFFRTCASASLTMRVHPLVVHGNILPCCIIKPRALQVCIASLLHCEERSSSRLVRSWAGLPASVATLGSCSRRNCPRLVSSARCWPSQHGFLKP